MPLRLYPLFLAIVTLPFAIRKVFWSLNTEYFSEYTDISVYLFEIFLLLYVCLYILEHKYIIKSIIRKMFHVEHILLVILLSLSTIFAIIFNEAYFSAYLLIRWIFYGIVGFLIYRDLHKIVPRGTINSDIHKNTQNCSTWNNLQIIVLVSLLSQSLIIIWQVIFQGSMGIIWLGESILNPAIAGVATVIINNLEFLRGYGTFLHPNITAFFFFSYIFTYIVLVIVPRGTSHSHLITKNCSTWNTLTVKSLNIWSKLRQYVPRGTKNMENATQVCSTWNNTDNIYDRLFHVEQLLPLNLQKYVPRGTSVLVWVVILCAFLLTFSKSVIVVSVVVGIYVYCSICSTWNNYAISIEKSQNMFHPARMNLSGWVEQLTKILRNVPRGTIVVFVLCVVIVIGYLKVDMNTFVQQSILERKSQYLSIPVDTIDDVLLGNGLGSYVPMLTEKSPGLFFWQLQPIHNTFILAIFEIGAIPLIIVFLYFSRQLKRNKTGESKKRFSDTQKIGISVVTGVLLLLLVDHYMWDIEQGQFLFVLCAVMLMLLFKYQDTQK